MKRHPPAKLKVMEIDGKDTCEKLVELVRDIPIPIAQAVFYHVSIPCARKVSKKARTKVCTV